MDQLPPRISASVHTPCRLRSVGGRTCWDRSADQTFLSVYGIVMDVGDPKFSVGEAGRQLFTLVFWHLGTFFSAFGLLSRLPQHF